MIEITPYRHLLGLLRENIINAQLRAGSSWNVRSVVLGGRENTRQQEHTGFPLLIKGTMPHAAPKRNLRSIDVPLSPLFLFVQDWDHQPAEQTSMTDCHEMVTFASDNSRQSIPECYTYKVVSHYQFSEQSQLCFTKWSSILMSCKASSPTV